MPVADVEIDNPFSGIILAGMIRGVYRAVEGVDGRCEWAIHPDGYMVVSVSPKLSRRALAFGETVPPS